MCLVSSLRICCLNSGHKDFFLFSSKRFFKHIFYWLCYYSCPISPPFFPSTLHTPSHPHSPFSSCPWVIHISSLAATFLTLLITFPCLFSTYNLCYLFSVPFPPLSPSHFPADYPPCDLHFCDSVPVIVCLVCFCLGSVVNSCEFIDIFTVHIFLSSFS